MDLVLNEEDSIQRKILDHAGTYLHIVGSVADKISTHRIVPDYNSQPVMIVCEEYGRLALHEEHQNADYLEISFSVGSALVWPGLGAAEWILYRGDNRKE